MDTAPERLGLLRSPIGRRSAPSVGVWRPGALGVGAFALTVGVLSTAFSKANLSTSLEKGSDGSVVRRS